MAFEEGLSWIPGIFNNVNLFGVTFLFGLILVLATLVIITRDVSKWPMMAFPVTTLWSIVGIEYSKVWWGVSSIMFVLWAINTVHIGNIIQGVSRRVTSRDKIMQEARDYNLRKSLKWKDQNKQLQKEIAKKIKQARKKEKKATTSFKTKLDKQPHLKGMWENTQEGVTQIFEEPKKKKKIINRYI